VFQQDAELERNTKEAQARATELEGQTQELVQRLATLQASVSGWAGWPLVQPVYGWVGSFLCTLWRALQLEEAREAAAREQQAAEADQEASAAMLQEQVDWWVAVEGVLLLLCVHTCSWLLALVSRASEVLEALQELYGVRAEVADQGQGQAIHMHQEGLWRPYGWCVLTFLLLCAMLCRAAAEGDQRVLQLSLTYPTNHVLDLRLGAGSKMKLLGATVSDMAAFCRQDPLLPSHCCAAVWCAAWQVRAAPVGRRQQPQPPIRLDDVLAAASSLAPPQDVMFVAREVGWRVSSQEVARKEVREIMKR
jgi:hypothetical protein